MLQTLDGGILTEFERSRRQPCRRGRVVARLDPTRSESMLAKVRQNIALSLAASIRLTAEVNNQPLIFPPSLKAWPGLLAEETRLYHESQGAANEVCAATGAVVIAGQ